MQRREFLKGSLAASALLASPAIGWSEALPIGKKKSMVAAYYLRAGILTKDGAPHLRKNQGAIGSFYHPETQKYVTDFALETIDKWDVDGLVWDEPKCTWWQDFSPLAQKSNPSGGFRKYIKDMAAFFSEVNQEIKNKKKNCTIVHFDEALRRAEVVEESAKIDPMDFYGCDGKPWSKQFPTSSEKGTPKNLFDNGKRYLKEARKNRVGSFYLIENFNLDKEKNDLLEKYLPQVIEMDVGMLGYYFYGSGLIEPERTMKITAQNLKAFKRK